MGDGSIAPGFGAHHLGFFARLPQGWIHRSNLLIIIARGDLHFFQMAIYLELGWLAYMPGGYA